MDRRQFLNHGTAGLAALGLGSMSGIASATEAVLASAHSIEPLRASADRIFRTTVCLRPFRAAGPRIEVEEVGRKRVVHNYGHGGSGWSLSWGSAMLAVPMALEGGAQEIAVVGAGALGLTAALTAQRMGAKVTIYAKERFPLVRSARATGTWSPDSRVAMAKDVDAGFADRWETMARTSFSTFQGFLGMAGTPVEWTDRYMLLDMSLADTRAANKAKKEGKPADFLHLEERLQDITPRALQLGPGMHPFSTPYAAINSSLTFNVADLMHQLESDFLLAGGRMVPMEFFTPSDFSRIKEKVVINCTGYGARALWKDESIVPVRGQIAWLIPQANAIYGVGYKTLNVLARRDGIVVQESGQDEWFGYNDANETPDMTAAYNSVAQLAGFFAKPAPVAGGVVAKG
jgi:glycine/D-amino acid oxidase-like deaminating enzyme